MKIINGRVFHEERGFVSEELCIQRGRIISCDSGDDDIFDAEGCYVIPGLIDVHFHGAMGHDFCDGTPEAINAIAEYEFSQGVTSICPATMTLSKESLIPICQNGDIWAKAHNGDLKKSRLVGIHLEGPFLSQEKIGAQNPKFLASPNMDFLKSLQEASGGHVRLLSMAPQHEGALDFIREIKMDQEFDSINISIAHTTANYDVAKEAFEAGANHVTHMYNAMPPFSHRDPGVIGAAFDTPECFAEIICDGVHIHAAVIRATFAMFGSNRMVLISDSMRAVGLSDGQYDLGGQEVTVRGNRATLPGDVIAGSVTNLMDCMRTAVSFGIPLDVAVKCASINPAKSIGIDEDYGSLTLGKVADLVILDKDLKLVKVMKDGKF